MLFWKYFKIKLPFKRPIMLILISVIIGVIFGTYFNLILVYKLNFHYVNLDPLFTLPISFTAFYLIISNREKKIEY